MESLDDMELVILLLYLRRRLRRKKKRSVWVREIFQRRQKYGDYHNLVQEMRLNDPESHFRYFRMSKERFDHLLNMIEPLIARRHYYSPYRPEVSPAEKLAVTLRYLATGDSQVSMSFNFRLGRSTVCSILKDTCEAIWDALNSLYLKAPSTEEEWIEISKGFESMWNFPNCIGAIDGKHIVIQAPMNAGSAYFNYKGTHSIVLLAVCDAEYCFKLVDIGDYGRQSDSGIFSNCEIGSALEEGVLSIPNGRSLPGTSYFLPYVMVGDEGFPLKKFLLRPYPGRYISHERSIFNYRLSRARRIIENTFGILAARWRLFRRTIIANPENIVSFTKAAVVLHNYLRKTECVSYCPPGFVDGEDGVGNVIEGSWRSDSDSGNSLLPLQQSTSNRHAIDAGVIRDNFTTYFNSETGRVSWQENHVTRAM